MKTVKHGSRIELRYKIVLANGTVVEDAMSEDPIGFEIGQGELPEKVERRLLNKSGGDCGSVRIKTADMAFGKYDVALIQLIERTEFDDDLNLQPGQLIDFDLPDDRSVAGRINTILADQVEVDFNHPLCGHDLEFVYQLVGIV